MCRHGPAADACSDWVVVVTALFAARYLSCGRTVLGAFRIFLSQTRSIRYCFRL